MKKINSILVIYIWMLILAFKYYHAYYTGRTLQLSFVVLDINLTICLCTLYISSIIDNLKKQIHESSK